jgi:hypothetical protein
MTPKEKAEELFNKFNSALIDEIKHNAARNFASFNCALIAVNEILFSGVHKDNYYLDKSLGYTITFQEYYQEVKQELTKL